VFAWMENNCLRLKCASHPTFQPLVGNVTWNIRHAAETAPAVTSTHHSVLLLKEPTSPNKNKNKKEISSVKDHLFFRLPSATGKLCISWSALPLLQEKQELLEHGM